jgi:hypothetical protein
MFNAEFGYKRFLKIRCKDLVSICNKYPRYSICSDDPIDYKFYDLRCVKILLAGDKVYVFSKSVDGDEDRVVDYRSRSLRF